MRAFFLIAGLLPAVLATAGNARLLRTQKDALALAFPKGTLVEKKTAFLTAEQRKRAQKLAQVRVESGLWTYYVGKKDGVITGYALFDRVVVRTHPATLMAAIAPDGSLRFIELLTFDEPQDFLPRDRWLKLLQNGRLGRDLSVGAGIPNVSGATLTCHALVDAARRMLSVYQVLYPQQPK